MQSHVQALAGLGWNGKKSGCEKPLKLPRWTFDVLAQSMSCLEDQTHKSRDVSALQSTTTRSGRWWQRYRTCLTTMNHEFPHYRQWPFIVGKSSISTPSAVTRSSPCPPRLIPGERSGSRRVSAFAPASHQIVRIQKLKIWVSGYENKH